MMEYKLISCTTEPIDWEKLLVSVKAIFRMDETDYTMVGFAKAANAMPSALSEAVNEAKLDAEDRFKKLIGGAPQGHEKMVIVLREAMKGNEEESKQRILDTKITNNPEVKNKDSATTKFLGPADEIRQQKIDDLCEVLGISSIDVLGDEPWAFYEAVTLIEVLEAATKKYEIRESSKEIK